MATIDTALVTDIERTACQIIRDDLDRWAITTPASTWARAIANGEEPTFEEYKTATTELFSDGEAYLKSFREFPDADDLNVTATCYTSTIRLAWYIHHWRTLGRPTETEFNLGFGIGGTTSLAAKIAEHHQLCLFELTNLYALHMRYEHPSP